MNNTTITTQRQNHVELSRLIAIEGMVLLKNENNTLPLKDKNIALFGSGARFTHKGGTGSGDVYTFKNVTIEDGLVNYGYNNTAEFYLNECSEISKIREIERRKKIRNEAKKVGLTDWNGSMFIATKYPFGQNIDRLITIDDVNKCNCDTGMYVISRQAGEGGDRKNEKGDYYLTDVEKENIQFIVDHFKNSIVILNTAAPIDIKDVYDSNASAIILYGQAGQEGGNALASLISGESNFSGKLTVSWPQKLEDLEISKDYSYLDGKDDIEDYYDDIYVGYRYYDSFGKKPLFPFGFGLSYTTFENKASYKIEGNDLVIDVCVKNTGLAKGKETIQCYSSAIGLDIDKEVKSLISFKKTRLIGINDSCNITLKIDLLDLATYIENEHKYVLKKGTYAISLGNSSDNT
ncbi:MAG: glycoside hydrolase family 3 C-terminal domain-containing protein, partial [Clostridia bacterium]|nr:glycoside hydrolase family 3 C-terminal domain-containing protein [Clostridia bacterium]